MVLARRGSFVFGLEACAHPRGDAPTEQRRIEGALDRPRGTHHEGTIVENSEGRSKDG